MAGPLVPFGMVGAEQCVFLSGSRDPVWKIRGITDFGNPGTALGLGKDKGMELAEKYDAAAVFADSDKNIYVNKKAKNIFTLTKDGYTVVE